MILPVHDRLRAHLARLLTTRLFTRSVGTAAARPRVPAQSRPRRPRHAGGVRAGAPAAQGAAGHRAGDRRRLRRARRRPRSVAAAPNGYLNFFLDRPAFLRERLTSAASARAHGERQGDRRAHGDQSEQGRAHRPPAQRRARRHAGPRPALPRHSRSKCRTTSTTPACRWPTWWSDSACSSSKTLDEIRADRRYDALRLLLLGSLRARRPSGTTSDKERLKIRAADAARHRARRQRERRAWPRSSPTASSAATCRRWRG